MVHRYSYLFWALFISTVAVFGYRSANDSNHAIFGPRATLADMLAGLADEIQRHPGRKQYEARRYTSEAGRTFHSLNAYTLWLRLRIPHAPRYGCESLYFEPASGKLLRGEGAETQLGMLVFPRDVFSNVSLAAILKVARDKGVWCDFKWNGGSEVQGCDKGCGCCG